MVKKKYIISAKNLKIALREGYLIITKTNSHI